VESGRNTIAVASAPALAVVAAGASQRFLLSTTAVPARRFEYSFSWGIGTSLISVLMCSTETKVKTCKTWMVVLQRRSAGVASLCYRRPCRHCFLLLRILAAVTPKAFIVVKIHRRTLRLTIQPS
jgi:hypothetical protein